jgi:hypothetical protein
MPELSRRSFLSAASMGAAVVGAAAMAPGAVLPAVQEAGPALDQVATDMSSVDGPVVAHLVDGASGTVALYHADRMVTVVDPSLARALIAAVR